MTFKDIAVQLDTAARSQVRLDVAIELARGHGAHLTGFYVVDVPDSTYLYGGAVPYASGGLDLVGKLRSDLLGAGTTVEARFLDKVRREGMAADWRLCEGRTGEMTALNARYADLVVVGQPHDPNATETERSDNVVVTALMSSGRPVLVVPFAGDFKVIGQRILVAWNASREATRAVNDAMPLLKRAAKVTILAINPRPGTEAHGDVPGAEIALHLARHGVTAEAAQTVSGDIPDGETLLSYAADIGADLIVAGGYGHSRALVFGGVTQSLLRSMTVPVFLSH
jgi:nucleotide-binding universal stress UspA family protein